MVCGNWNLQKAMTLTGDQYLAIQAAFFLSANVGIHVQVN